MKSIKTSLVGRTISAALAVMAATLFAAQPMSWEEYLALTRGPSPQDGIGRFRLEGVEKTFYYDAPHALEQGSACELAVVLVHGWGGGIRRASAMAPLMCALAKGTGQGVAPPYVVAPLFPRSDLLRRFGSAARDLAQWNASWKENNRSVRGKAQDDWRGGGDAVGTTMSSYDVIDRIFAVLGDRERYPNLRRVVLSGFSAGGQFAGRYAAVGKGKVREGVEVAYVAMAPSTELRFDPELEWRYGIKGRPRYSAALTEQAILANLSSRRVWRGCGTQDVLAKPHTALDGSPEAMAQGTNRIERFWNFKRYLKRFPSWEKQVSFHAFNGLGHNALGAYSDPAVVDFMLHGDANLARERAEAVKVPEKCAESASAGAVVFRPGQSEIVIETNACDTIRVAAEEARDFMGQALGYDVPIVTAPTPSRTALFLGPNRWADAAGVTTNGLKRDGFRIRTAANGVYVLGIDDSSVNAHRNRQRGGIWFQNFERATVFGVYDFLERFAGVRFYFPGELGTVVPRAAQIVVPPTDLVDAPANTVRRYTIYETGCPYFEGENAAELRHPMKTINWWRTRMETEYMPCCHGQNKFKYMDRFAKSHPEYFALLEDGRRHNSPKITYPGHPGQLCHTSAIWEEIYQDVKSYLSGEDASVRRIPVDSTLPGADGKVTYGWGVNCQRREIVDVMAQDGMIKCACERCKAEWAKAPEIGWASDLMWGNVARLANRLKAEGVKGRVSMMAYSKYRRVPDFPIPDNVEVMVAERGPWTENDPSERARELAEIRAWHDKIGRKVSLWTYLNKPSSLPDVPNCTPKAVARYFQQLAPLTYGAFLQDWSDHWLSQYLPRYVFGKVMWNPVVDVEALLDEHHRLMFGKAAPEMKRFFEEIERIYITRVAGKTIDTALGPQSEKPSPYELFVRIYSPETVDALEALFDAASAKVATGSLEARRIALIRREMFDPLAKRARAYVASIDVAKGLARDRASTKPNLVPVRIMPEGNGHLVCDGTRKMFGVSLRDADGKSSLKPGRRYRLSYCIKLDNLQPVKFNGGANVNVWAGMNFWLPSVPFSGTQDWIYQSFDFTAGEKTGEKGPSLLRLQIVNAKGEAWFDHVRIEELD